MLNNYPQKQLESMKIHNSANGSVAAKKIQFDNEFVEAIQAEAQATFNENDGICVDDTSNEVDTSEGKFQSLKSNLPTLILSSLFNGRLQLEVSQEGKKQKVVARKESGILAMDVFNLSEGVKRAVFVQNLKTYFTEEELLDIMRELLSLADRLSELPIGNSKCVIIQTSFKILEDGRIIEQIRNGYAVYDSHNDVYSIEEEIIGADGTLYRPVEDELFLKDGGIQLANELIEYGTEAELDADIERYISTYLDLKPLQLKLTAKYIRFTYISDKVLELSYLNPTGDPGSGKSRFGLTICIASHRGLSLITPSAASLFRIVDKFKPTLFIDEFNSNANSDDAAAIIQILNAGFQKTAQIPRQVATGDGNFKTEMFDAFCPKIIGSIKQSASNAFNSRCIEIQMERTTRNDIPLRLSQKLLNDAQKIRNKLTLWRLRNLNKDFEAKLEQAENELRNAEIIPRSIQINIPLYALIEDESLKTEFKRLLKGRDEILYEEKQITLDGEIVKAFHNILFRSGYDVKTGEDTKEALWKIDRPVEAIPCEDLRIEKIVSMLNNIRKEKDHLNEKYIGKKISGLGLRSTQILRRKSDYHKKSAVVFDSYRLKVIFSNYGLPIPIDFSLDQSDQSNKLNINNDLCWSEEKQALSQAQISLDQPKPSNDNNSNDWSNWSKENQEISECPNCKVDYYYESDGTPFCQFCFGKK